MTSLPFASFSKNILTSPSIYEWVRNYHGLMQLRVSCWKHCWMSDAGWTEWKNYSRPRWNYVAWLPGSTLYAVFRSTTLGTRSLFVNGSQQFETNIQALKNVQRLRTSKSLTCDELNAWLTSTSGSAKKPSRQSVYGYADWGTSGRISFLSCGRGNGKQRLIDEYKPDPNVTWGSEKSDPLQDMRDFMERRRNALWQGLP